MKRLLPLLLLSLVGCNEYVSDHCTRKEAFYECLDRLKGETDRIKVCDDLAWNVSLKRKLSVSQECGGG